MDSYFTELGRTVLARWQAQNFSLAAFPSTALFENVRFMSASGLKFVRAGLKR